MFSVIGGTYVEDCLEPNWNRLFGSGLRAVLSLKDICSDDLEYISIASEDEVNLVDTMLNSCDVKTKWLHTRKSPIKFVYDYSIASPFISTLQNQRAIKSKEKSYIELDNVLIFSFVEYKARPLISANHVTYDPQAGQKSIPWSQCGNNAKSLSLVMNLTEAKAIAEKIGVSPDLSIATLANKIRIKEKAEVVIIKNGVWGAHLCTDKNSHVIPVYKTDKVFGIGSGDVFSAVYSALWSQGVAPLEAAKKASCATAFYCNSEGALPIPNDFDSILDKYEEKLFPPDVSKKVYLAGPFFCLSELWLVNQAFCSLRALGFDVWSPSREAGILPKNASQSQIENVVNKDLEGLEICDVVFAILDGNDPGTIFEIGYAVKKNIPVICYAPNSSQKDITMMIGSNCVIKHDFSSAMYSLAWSLG